MGANVLENLTYISEKKSVSSHLKMVFKSLLLLLLALPFTQGASCPPSLYSDSQGTIQSPGFNTAGRYDANMSCTYNIRVPAGRRVILEFKNLSILGSMPNCEEDSVEILVGCKNTSIGKFCSCSNLSMPDKIYSYDNCMTLVFKSDGSNQGKGFEAQYTTADNNETRLDPNNCSTDSVTSSYGTIYTPNWPLKYPASASCVWTFNPPETTTVRFFFTSFELDGDPICDSNRPPQTGDQISINGTNTTGEQITVRKRICTLPADAFFPIKDMKAIEVRFGSNSIRTNDGTGVMAGYATYIKGYVDSSASRCELVAPTLKGTTGTPVFTATTAIANLLPTATTTGAPPSTAGAPPPTSTTVTSPPTSNPTTTTTTGTSYPTTATTIETSSPTATTTIGTSSPTTTTTIGTSSLTTTTTIGTSSSTITTTIGTSSPTTTTTIGTSSPTTTTTIGTSSPTTTTTIGTSSPTTTTTIGTSSPTTTTTIGTSSPTTTTTIGTSSPTTTMTIGTSSPTTTTTIGTSSPTSTTTIGTSSPTTTTTIGTSSPTTSTTIGTSSPTTSTTIGTSSPTTTTTIETSPPTTTATFGTSSPTTTTSIGTSSLTTTTTIGTSSPTITTTTGTSPPTTTTTIGTSSPTLKQKTSCPPSLYTDSQGTIQSPGFNTTGRYDANMSCTYNIRVPAGRRIILEFKNLSILGSMPNCAEDSVEIIVGCSKTSIGKFCSCSNLSMPDKIYSYDNCMTLVFMSDGSNEGKGFEAQYTTADNNVTRLDHNNCSTDSVTPSHGTIYSPNWPLKYPDSASCVWTFNPPPTTIVRFFFTSFELDGDPICDPNRPPQTGDQISINGTNTTGGKIVVKKRICTMPSDAFFPIKDMKAIEVRFGSNSIRTNDGIGVMAGYATYIKGYVDSSASRCGLVAPTLNGTTGTPVFTATSGTPVATTGAPPSSPTTTTTIGTSPPTLKQKTCGYLSVVIIKEWDTAYLSKSSDTFENMRSSIDNAIGVMFKDASKYNNLELSGMNFTEKDGNIDVTVKLCIEVKKDDADSSVIDVIFTLKKTGKLGTWEVRTDSVTFKEIGVKFEDWKVEDEECSKCSEGGGGPFVIKRNCESKTHSCNGLKTMNTKDCTTYCDACSVAISSFTLVMGILLSFSFNIWK